MCEKMSVYAGEKRDQVNILRLCCGCGVCRVFSLFACCGCGVCGVFAAVLPRQYLHKTHQTNTWISCLSERVQVSPTPARVTSCVLPHVNRLVSIMQWLIQTQVVCRAKVAWSGVRCGSTYQRETLVIPMSPQTRTKWTLWYNLSVSVI